MREGRQTSVALHVEQAERIGRCRQGAPGVWPTYELPRDDPGHGCQRSLDKKPCFPDVDPHARALRTAARRAIRWRVMVSAWV